MPSCINFSKPRSHCVATELNCLPKVAFALFSKTLNEVFTISLVRQNWSYINEWMNENENLASFVRAAVFFHVQVSSLVGNKLSAREIAVFLASLWIIIPSVGSINSWVLHKETSARTMCHRKRQSISFYDEIFTLIDHSKGNFPSINLMKIFGWYFWPPKINKNRRRK